MELPPASRAEGAAEGRGGKSSQTFHRPREVTMALTTTRSAGMLVLAIYLIVVGLAGLVQLPIPLAVTALLALLAGILILLGK